MADAFGFQGLGRGVERIGERGKERREKRKEWEQGIGE